MVAYVAFRGPPKEVPGKEDEEDSLLGISCARSALFPGGDDRGGVIGGVAVGGAT